MLIDEPDPRVENVGPYSHRWRCRSMRLNPGQALHVLCVPGNGDELTGRTGEHKGVPN